VIDLAQLGHASTSTKVLASHLLRALWAIGALESTVLLACLAFLLPVHDQPRAEAPEPNDGIGDHQLYQIRARRSLALSNQGLESGCQILCMSRSIRLTISLQCTSECADLPIRRRNLGAFIVRYHIYIILQSSRRSESPVYCKALRRVIGEYWESRRR